MWEKTYDHFLRRFPKAAKKARQQLIREGVVDKNFIIIAEDDAGELVPLSLTRAQLLRHFPQYDADEKERRRLTALPPKSSFASWCHWRSVSSGARCMEGMTNC